MPSPPCGISRSAAGRVGQAPVSLLGRHSAGPHSLAPTPKAQCSINLSLGEQASDPCTSLPWWGPLSEY